jgi:hypothetical protein
MFCNDGVETEEQWRGCTNRRFKALPHYRIGSNLSTGDVIVSYVSIGYPGHRAGVFFAGD